MSTNKIFELYASYLWPIVRKFVKLSKRCNHCILSEKYVPLKNGICEKCTKNIAVNKESFEASTETQNLFQQTIQSVSYTHLDVYKRQHIGGPHQLAASFRAYTFTDWFDKQRY